MKKKVDRPLAVVKYAGLVRALTKCDGLYEATQRKIRMMQVPEFLLIEECGEIFFEISHAYLYSYKLYERINSSRRGSRLCG